MLTTTSKNSWSSEKKAQQLEAVEYRSWGMLPAMIPATAALTVRPFIGDAPSAARSIASGAMVSTTLVGPLGFGLSPSYRPTITVLHQTFQLFAKLHRDATPSDVYTSVIRYSIGMVIVPSVVKLLERQLKLPVRLAFMVLHYARLVHDISIRLEFEKFDKNYALKLAFDKMTEQFASCFGNFIMWISNFVSEQVDGQLANVPQKLKEKLLSTEPKIWDQIEENVSKFNADWEKYKYGRDEMERGCQKFGKKYEQIKASQEKLGIHWRKAAECFKNKEELFKDLPKVFG